jgi:hypothetical protein
VDVPSAPFTLAATGHRGSRFAIILPGNRNYGRDAFPHQGYGSTFPFVDVTLQASPVGNLFGQAYLVGFHFFVCPSPNEMEEVSGASASHLPPP